MFEIARVIGQHDGKKLELLMDTHGFKKKHLVEKLGKSHTTITKIFKSSKIPSFKLIEIGKALRFDLTQEFPELRQLPEAKDLNYFNENPSDLLNEVREIRQEYRNADQEKIELRQELRFMRDQIEQLREIIELKNEIIERDQAELKKLRKSQQ